MPGKNDKAKTVKGHVQRRVLNDNMAFLHMKYQAETSSKVSFSTFFVMRPKHIGLTRYLSRNKCLLSKAPKHGPCLEIYEKGRCGSTIKPR